MVFSRVATTHCEPNTQVNATDLGNQLTDWVGLSDQEDEPATAVFNFVSYIIYMHPCNYCYSNL